MSKADKNLAPQLSAIDGFHCNSLIYPLIIGFSFIKHKKSLICFNPPTFSGSGGWTHSPILRAISDYLIQLPTLNWLICSRWSKSQYWMFFINFSKGPFWHNPLIVLTNKELNICTYTSDNITFHVNKLVYPCKVPISVLLPRKT